MPNLLVDDIPLVDTRKTTSDTTTRNILYDACMKGAVLHTVLRATSRSTKKWSWPSALWGEIPIQEFTEIESLGQHLKSDFTIFDGDNYAAPTIVVRNDDTVPLQHQLPHQLSPCHREHLQTPLCLTGLKTDIFYHMIQRYFLTPQFSASTSI